MKQVKVLLIAPYEGMKEVAESVAAGREDIDLTVLVGNMQKGLKLVRECDQSRYDVIISRGGTAEIIREAASIPLVEIELTPYDIHNALAEVSGTQKQYMVAGSPRIVDAAATLCDLLNTQVKTVTIRNDAEGRALLPELKKQGIEILLCDMVGAESASLAGMESVLITSGVKGIEDALNRAAGLFSGDGREKRAGEIMKEELRTKGESLAVLNQSGQMLFALPEPALPPTVRNIFGRMVPAVLTGGEILTNRPMGGRDYRIEARRINYFGEPCVEFRYRNEGPKFPISTPGLQPYNSSERDMSRFARYYGGKGACLIERAERAAQSGLPVVICGEKGTLPDCMAGYICMQGVLAEQDCCVIDCPKIGSKGWNKLFSPSGLLAFRAGSTVLFEHFLEMADPSVENLIDFIRDTRLTNRLRLVFAATTGIYPTREKRVIKLIADQLYAVVLKLPAIRDQKEDIPDMLENVFTWVCADMGIRIPDIEQKGKEAMYGYRWPRNYPQLHRVVTQLLAECEAGTITEKQVITALAHEDKVVAFRPADDTLDLSGSIEDITYRIVKKVLAEEGMNRSRTARRLGISRATLWRILGKEE